MNMTGVIKQYRAGMLDRAFNTQFTVMTEFKS